MKLIHLSDLHLGKRVNEFSMLEDQKDILNKIEYYLKHEDERSAIAKNGHDKVAKEHTFDVRVKQIIDLYFTQVLAGLKETDHLTAASLDDRLVRLYGRLGDHEKV